MLLSPLHLDNMYKFTLTAGLCLIITGLASSCRLVCYYNSKAKDREADGKFTVSDIDPNLCTHVIYAFSDINSTNQLVPTNSSDLEDYRLLNELKQRNPQLKTLLSVGGINFDRQKFRQAVNNPVFPQSVITLLRANGFDGLNLDWRYPGGAGSEALDQPRFSLLTKDLREVFDEEGRQTNRSRLLITASVSAEKALIDASYDVSQIARQLDFINVLTFDFHGPWENVTGHHTPLYNGSQDTGNNIFLNTDFAMRYWRDKGAPPEKLNVGLAAYGRAFNLSTANSGVGAPANGPGEEGCYTGEEGFWAYYELCLYLEGVQIQQITDQGVPFATTENQWVGFDDLNSLEKKVNYTKANNFGGVVVWSLDLDDFTGKFCKMGNNSFISHLHTLLIPGCSNVTTTTPPTTVVTTPPTTVVTTLPTTVGTTLPTTVGTTLPTTVGTTLPITTVTTTSASATAAFENLPSTTIATTAPPPVTSNTANAVSSGNPCAGRISGLFADPSDPTFFFQCDGDRVFRISCPSGLNFDQACMCCNFPS